MDIQILCRVSYLRNADGVFVEQSPPAEIWQTVDEESVYRALNDPPDWCDRVDDARVAWNPIRAGF